MTGLCLTVMLGAATLALGGTVSLMHANGARLSLGSHPLGEPGPGRGLEFVLPERNGAQDEERVEVVREKERDPSAVAGVPRRLR